MAPYNLSSLWSTCHWYACMTMVVQSYMNYTHFQPLLTTIHMDQTCLYVVGCAHVYFLSTWAWLVQMAKVAQAHTIDTSLKDCLVLICYWAGLSTCCSLLNPALVVSFCTSLHIWSSIGLNGLSVTGSQSPHRLYHFTNISNCWSNTYIRRGTATPAHLLCGGDKLRW